MVLLAKDLKMSLLLDFYAPALTANQAEALRLYYNEDLSLAEIAEGSGITRQGVRDAIKRGESVMTELEARLGFARMYGDVSRVSDAIRTETQELQLLSQRGLLCAEADERVRRIISLLDELDKE